MHHAELWAFADAAQNSDAKGHALEEIICFLMSSVPGVGNPERNLMNAFGTEELDVIFWNARHDEGLYFMDNTILVECKNWSKAVDSQEVVYFAYRLWQRGARDGILVAASGITGNPDHLQRAHFEVGFALARMGVRLLVVRRNEIEHIATTEEIVELLRHKRMVLDGRGTTL